jgi:hypothetical protein
MEKKCNFVLKLWKFTSVWWLSQEFVATQQVELTAKITFMSRIN